MLAKKGVDASHKIGVEGVLIEHTASKPAVLHFVKGQARLTLGKEAMSAQPGSWVHMEPNLSHSVFAETELIMLLLLLENS